MLLACHGSPFDANDVIDSAAPDEAMAQYLRETAARVIGVGHMHRPLLR